LASDEVAGLGEVVVVEAFQQHVFSVGCRTARGPCVVVVFTHPSDTPGSIQWAECGPGHGRWGVTFSTKAAHRAVQWVVIIGRHRSVSESLRCRSRCAAGCRAG